MWRVRDVDEHLVSRARSRAGGASWEPGAGCGLEERLRGAQFDCGQLAADVVRSIAWSGGVAQSQPRLDEPDELGAWQPGTIRAREFTKPHLRRSDSRSFSDAHPVLAVASALCSRAARHVAWAHVVARKVSNGPAVTVPHFTRTCALVASTNVQRTIRGR